MEFYLAEEPASFEQFSKIYPDEAKILAPIVDHFHGQLFVAEDCFKVSLDGQKNIYIPVQETLNKHRRTFHKRSPYQENLARALGLKRENINNIKVLDATGGLLGDSLMLLAIGVKHLSVCERNPLLQCLILNALRRLPQEYPGVKFYLSSAEQMLGEFDVIYFDPMYHQKNTKAASKKEMIFMRNWVGADTDAKQQAQLLIKRCRRFVIKRSQKVESLLENPNHSLKGKSTHYDIYLNN